MNHLIKDTQLFTIKILTYVPKGDVEPNPSIILLKQNEKTYKMKETISGGISNYRNLLLTLNGGEDGEEEDWREDRGAVTIVGKSHSVNDNSYKLDYLCTFHLSQVEFKYMN